MKVPVLVAMALTASAVIAQPSQPRPRNIEAEDAALYFTDLIALPYAEICDKRIPGYLARFSPSHTRWRQENEARIKNGERALRAATPSMGETPESARDKALDVVRRLETAPQDLVDQQCRSIGRRVGMETP